MEGRMKERRNTNGKSKERNYILRNGYIKGKNIKRGKTEHRPNKRKE